MASEKPLSDEILRDAQTKADRIRKRAQRDAAKLSDDAAREAAAAAGKVVDIARRRADRVAQSLLATIEQEMRLDLLVAREAELDRLFDAARDRLAARAAYDYPTVVAGLAAEAIAAMGADGAVLELAERDQGLATSAWLADVRRRVGRDVAIVVSGTSAPITGGAIVRSADGRLLYDNSLEARLRRLRPELRKELAARLFGYTGGTPVPPAKAAGAGA